MSNAKEKSFERNMTRLQEIVQALESGELPLEDGMRLYREGMKCSQYCREQLEKARHELTLWQDGEESSLTLQGPTDRQESLPGENEA